MQLHQLTITGPPTVTQHPGQSPIGLGMHLSLVLHLHARTLYVTGAGVAILVALQSYIKLSHHMSLCKKVLNFIDFCCCCFLAFTTLALC